MKDSNITILESDEEREKSEKNLLSFLESFVFIGADGKPLPEPNRLPKDISIDYDDDRAGGD